MSMLIAAAAVFVITHLAIAGTGLRAGLVRVLGEGGYMLAFSTISVGSLVWLAYSYNLAQSGGADAQWWQSGRGLHDSGILAVGLAFFLGVQGLLSANPTSVAQGKAARDPAVVQGVLRITRHPFLWAVALWSAFHAAVNGDEASVIFFAAFLVLSLLGTWSIDAKRRRALGPAWDDFAKRTSSIPFAAVLRGSATLNIAESFGWRFWAAMAVFIAVLFAHLWLFGVSPFPGGWRPY